MAAAGGEVSTEREAVTQLQQELEAVAKRDVESLLVAEHQYGSSWKRRGGVGAFMMLARKWDRLENALRPLVDPLGRVVEPELAAISPFLGRSVSAWDIFAVAAHDRRAEGVIDDIRDLRRYLLLVETELVRQGVVHGTLAKEEKHGRA